MKLYIFILLVCPFYSLAQISFDKIFTDHMVLQRDKPITISGRSLPGTKVKIQLQKQIKQTITGTDSVWKVILDPLTMHKSPLQLTAIATGKKIILKDILVGDVWVCLGQSNMEWPMQNEMHYDTEKNIPPNPMLRFFDPVYAGQGVYGKAFSDSILNRLNSDDFYQGYWENSDSTSLPGMSAVGYYFGKELLLNTGVPIGLINLSIGGAPLETFMSIDALEREFPDKTAGSWLENPSIATWVKQRGKENLERAKKDNHPFKPGFAFASGIQPLLNFPVKGIIWYQGESNAQEPERVNEYRKLFISMVNDYRQKWKDKDLPFYFVQLSSIDSIKYKSQLWPMFRDEQRKISEELPYSGMAVCTDHGALHDVHPHNKKIVGERLSLIALKNLYGKEIVSSGPLPEKAIWKNGILSISFMHSGKGLQTRRSAELKGFSLNGKEEVQAGIKDDRVLIRADKMPEHVYYGWEPFSDANLQNDKNLPASTFKINVDNHELTDYRLYMNDSMFTTYYHQRVSQFRQLPFTKGDIIFLGNSISDGGEWSELFNDLRIKNRGISGDYSAGVIYRIDELTGRKPAKIFLLIGINDLARNITADSLTKNLAWIADYIKTQSPGTALYIQSILPVSNNFGKFGNHTAKAEQVRAVNAWLEQHERQYQYRYINLFDGFADQEGKLDKRYTNDGLHLTGEGYAQWKHLVYPYVYDRELKPALIPLPVQLQWETGAFPLYACKSIVIREPALIKEASLLKTWLMTKGIDAVITDIEAGPSIVLEKDKTILQNEGYRLKVSTASIHIKGSSAAGVFYGLQTLCQLMRDGTMADACEIIDYPAYPWRGYMVDVGRNFMSVDLLKQQIDIMAAYKMNIFHFHLTEDIAWRVEVPGYPQLTSPESMTRNKGSYYSVAEMTELITYCKDRYITLVPEIDMPGHSKAFSRAMGMDMQTVEGKIHTKKIVEIFCDTYDLPYMHIGGDEVKIKDSSFLPEITNVLLARGKKVIGWLPGGNHLKSTARQLWVRDKPADTTIPYIDSRHLYLNHMDPMEAVTTIYHRMIGGEKKAKKNVWGSTLCLWHDRNVSKEKDLLVMNPVYPGLLAFAERTWRGGGDPGWITNMSTDNMSFFQFEKRLTDHKGQYFKDMPFAYVSQSMVNWSLFGPYENKGNLSTVFVPEFHTADLTPVKVIPGVTVILRHFWDPYVKGVLDTPAENTTWYGSRVFWSETDTIKKFRIGFNNISRSYNTDSPAEGSWNSLQSKVFFNGNEIQPPKWSRPGQKGNSELPLLDEGYEYREPTNVKVNKGWNRILVKLPVGSFKSEDSGNPVKWMFTIAEEE